MKSTRGVRGGLEASTRGAAGGGIVVAVGAAARGVKSVEGSTSSTAGTGEEKVMQRGSFGTASVGVGAVTGQNLT